MAEKQKKKKLSDLATEHYRPIAPITDPEGAWTGVPADGIDPHVPAMSPEWMRPTDLTTYLKPPYDPEDMPVQDADDL